MASLRGGEWRIDHVNDVLAGLIDDWKNRGLTPSKVPTGEGAFGGGKGVKLYADDQKRLVDEGSEIRTMSPQEFGAFMKAENTRWVKVVQDAGIKPQ